MSEAEALKSELRALANPEKAKILSRFFKTEPGGYGEGDRFLGIVVPNTRKVARAHLKASSRDIRNLLASPYHEERLAALIILVEQYRRGDEITQNRIFDLYLASASRINNWDLVDLSAQHIVGAYIEKRDRSLLKELACSENLWKRRIAILSTFYFIRKGESKDALLISEMLLCDKHDLIHKAVGWMLREVGNRCSLSDECHFLDQHAVQMPRTMLRYAIERFPPALKEKYLKRPTPKHKKTKYPPLCL
jgi:3-methyladenine DNA glycosylase AlkD